MTELQEKRVPPSTEEKLNDIDFYGKVKVRSHTENPLIIQVQRYEKATGEQFLVTIREPDIYKGAPTKEATEKIEDIEKPIQKPPQEETLKATA